MKIGLPDLKIRVFSADNEGDHFLRKHFRPLLLPAGALPYDKHAPTLFLEKEAVAFVSLPVSAKLLVPEAFV